MQLSKEERSAKKDAKLTEDTSLGVNVGVFRVGDVTDHQKKYKVFGVESDV